MRTVQANEIDSIPEDIKIACNVLKAANLDIAINIKEHNGDYFIKPFFLSQEGNFVYDEEGARKYVADLIERITPPKVGDGCSVLGYSDVYACHVIEVSADGKRIKVQEDEAKLLNAVNSGEPDALTFEPGGFCGHTSGRQRWDLKPNPNGRVYEFTFRRNARWVLKGESMNSQSVRFSKNHYHHYDFNF